jgi:hypothetical protein
MTNDGVRVAVRTRPISKKEQQLGSKCCLVLNQSRAEVEITDFKKQEKDATKKFTFDFVYDVGSEQVELFKELGIPLLDRAIVSWVRGLVSWMCFPSSSSSFYSSPSPSPPLPPPGWLQRHNICLRSNRVWQDLDHDGERRETWADTAA